MNMDLYNHGTLGVAPDKLCQPWKCWMLRGLGSFANHRSKIWPFFVLLKHCKHLTDTAVTKHSTVETKTFLIRSLCKQLCLNWWRAVKEAN